MTNQMLVLAALTIVSLLSLTAQVEGADEDLPRSLLFGLTPDGRMNKVAHYLSSSDDINRIIKFQSFNQQFKTYYRLLNLCFFHHSKKFEQK